MILEDATYEAYGYYPRDLKSQSGKRIIAACEKCGAFRFLKRQDYKTFCRLCIQGHKNLNGSNNPNWKGGLVERICEICKKVFHVKQECLKYGGAKYCSTLCATKARMHNAKPYMTVPELEFQCICEKYNLPFKFVGNGSLWLGNANPDFVHNTKKIVVEVFGDYFHSPLLNKKVKYIHTLQGRTLQLKAEGYKCIILWESDLKRKDAEAFVVSMLKNGKNKI